VRRGNGDAALFFLGRLVDLIKGNELRAALQPIVLGDRRCQGRLAMIDVTNGPNIDMGLLSLKFCLRHLVLRWSLIQ
jgi:hypothetical protein